VVDSEGAHPVAVAAAVEEAEAEEAMKEEADVEVTVEVDSEEGREVTAAEVATIEAGTSKINLEVGTEEVTVGTEVAGKEVVAVVAGEVIIDTRIP
jgi:hypothetical protein